MCPRHTHTLALLPSVKRQVFCVGNRLKMVKHKACAITIVVPKSVGSMTTKGQMKPTCRVSFKASQAGENSQKQCRRTYDRIQYSNRPALQEKSKKNSTVRRKSQEKKST